MSYRKKILIWVVVFFIPIVFFLAPAVRSFFYCDNPRGYPCSSIFLNEPLYISFCLFGSLIVSFLLLLPFSRAVFLRWKKFARIAIPLMILWFITAPQDGGCSALAPCYDRAFVAFVSGGIYLLLSIIFTITYAMKEKNPRSI